MADFALRQSYQESSFPALMARQMDTIFPQPLFQNPGIWSPPGFQVLPVRVPAPYQTTVRTQFPPPLFVFNLSVPGFRLVDSLYRRPSAPLIQPRDPSQTVTNLILGFPALILGPDKPLWTQLEYAVQLNATLAVVELGYYEVLEAAATGDLGRLPDVVQFRSDYARMVAALRRNFAEVIVTTVPDPFDTAYFSTSATVARMNGLAVSEVTDRYRLHDGDWVTIHGLTVTGEVSPNAVRPAAAAAEIRSRVRALNEAIAAVAQQNGAIVYDLGGLFARVRAGGLPAGARMLTADYLGGFYALCGYYPGWTGHAAIANEMLALLNRTFGRSFALVDLAKVAENDPAVRFMGTGVSR